MIGGTMVASLYMILSAFLYSLQNVAVRYSGSTFGFWTVCLIRGLVGVLFSLCWMEKCVSVHIGNWKYLMLRSILGGATILLSFYSIEKCGMTTTTAITATASIWTALLGNLMMPEKYKWSYIDIVLAVWCVAGVMTLSIEKDGHFSFHFSPILSAICQAGVNLTIKRLDQEPATTVAFWGMMGSIVMGLPGFLYEWIEKKVELSSSSHDAGGMMALFATGILSLLAQYYKTLSIQTSTMSVLVLRHMDVLFAILWDYLLFHQRFQWYNMMGVAMILTGCGVKILLKEEKTPPVLPT